MLRLTLILGLIATLTDAQTAGLPDLSGLPECASGSALSGIKATGCKLTDLTCICKSPAFIKAVGTQIAASCSQDDQKKALTFANSICEPLGVTVPSEGLAVAPSAADAAAAPTAGADTPTATNEAKEVPSASETVDAGADATDTGAADASATDAPPYPVPSGNVTNSTSESNSTVASFAGAASRSGIALSGVAVALMVAGGLAVM